MMIDSMMDIMHRQKGNERNQVNVQYAVVDKVADGRPVIRFTGEEGSSSKEYICVKPYVPAVGDRVMILNDVIIGGWAFME